LGILIGGGIICLKNKIGKNGKNKKEEPMREMPIIQHQQPPIDAFNEHIYDQIH
jgi:hypothetical protein